MTEVIQLSPSQLSSSSSSSMSPTREIQEIDQEQREQEKETEREEDQLSILELLVTVLRRSVVGCSVITTKELCKMEIGLPTDVRHVAHVTFDRFNGFLGLPIEFEPEIPTRAPSASATVFGVSTESMQLSYDSRGNSVPVILLMMQRHLYAQGGLKAEGIFRINAENSQEEYLREELNRGVVPQDIDVHCLAGLVKAWFRELPTGVLDSLSQEQVMQSQSEEECIRLTRLLPPTEAALFDWAINLMADVAQLEHLNKMNARNVAMVFAPNMTQMSDPLTALMYAVQVMNFLQTLIVRTMREREESVIESALGSRFEPSDENGHQSSNQACRLEANEDTSIAIGEEKVFATKEPAIEDFSTGRNWFLVDNCPCKLVTQVTASTTKNLGGGFTGVSRGVQARTCKNRVFQSNNSSFREGLEMENEGASIVTGKAAKKSRGIGMLGSINPRTELFEAWL